MMSSSTRVRRSSTTSTDLEGDNNKGTEEMESSDDTSSSAPPCCNLTAATTNSQEYERRLIHYARSQQWCDFVVFLRANIEHHHCNIIFQIFTETIIEEMLNSDTPQFAVDAFLSSCHFTESERFLRAACKLGASYEVIQPLLKLKTSPEKMSDQLGRNPLIHYVKSCTKANNHKTTRHKVLADLIVAFPYLPILPDGDGLTALHWALRNTVPGCVVEHLLQVSSASASIRDARGEIALHYFCRAGFKSWRLDVLSKILMCYPAGVLEENQLGETPVEILWKEFSKTQVCKEIRQQAKDFLVSSRSSSHRLIFSKVLATFLNCIKMLLLVATAGSLELHLPPKTTSEYYKWNLLNAASQIGTKCVTDLFEFLLFIHFRHPMKCDGEGMLPLHFIAASVPHRDELGEPHLRKVLRNFPESSTVADRKGMLPLHIASSKKEGSGSSLRALLAAYPEGAQIMDKSGRLPIHHAILAGGKWKNQVQILFDAYPLSLTAPDKNTGLYPFMLAAFCDSCSLDVSYNLLRADPSCVVAERKVFTKRRKTGEAVEESRLQAEKRCLANQFTSI